MVKSKELNPKPKKSVSKQVSKPKKSVSKQVSKPKKSVSKQVSKPKKSVSKQVSKPKKSVGKQVSKPKKSVGKQVSLLVKSVEERDSKANKKEMGELVLNRKGQYGGKLGEITKTQGDTKPIFMEYYGNSDLINWGYWYEDTKDQKEACGNLMEELLAFIPKKTGNILDVASENSSSSHYLLKYFKPEKITGISTSGTQLEIYKKKSPGSKFLLMEPTNLDFKEASFANVICVEGAPRFRTRNKFIEEAYRVLKPRGKLILTDIMANQNIFKEGTQFPKENYLENIESYRSLLKKIGFRKVEIRDALHSCWKGMYYNFMRFLKKKTEERELRFFASKIINNKLFIFDQNLSGYLLIVAEKPE